MSSPSPWNNSLLFVQRHPSERAGLLSIKVLIHFSTFKQLPGRMLPSCRSASPTATKERFRHVTGDHRGFRRLTLGSPHNCRPLPRHVPRGSDHIPAPTFISGLTVILTHLLNCRHFQTSVKRKRSSVYKEVLWE